MCFVVKYNSIFVEHSIYYGCNKLFMIKSLACAFLLLFTVILRAQIPNWVIYQTMVRDEHGKPLPYIAANFQFRVHDSTPLGNVIFAEIDSLKANSFGLVSVRLGADSLRRILNQTNSKKYLEVGIDLTGGTNFVEVGRCDELLLGPAYVTY
jgi:hypothetical protein